jgi:hypothetical protein
MKVKVKAVVFKNLFSKAPIPRWQPELPIRAG